MTSSPQPKAFPARLLRAAVGAAGLAVSGLATAAVLSYSGNFASDDEHAMIAFSLGGSVTVSARTLSYGGGTNAAGASFAAGGFVPVLSLFAATGTQDLLGLANGSSFAAPNCVGATDPATGFCWDAGFDLTLAAGDYVLVLTQDDNLPGATLPDAFSRDGQGDFTGPSFLGVAGAFIAADGSQRSNFWALDLTLPDANQAPEPSALVLALLALTSLWSARRRTLQRPG